jgi:hypothetical protein
MSRPRVFEDERSVSNGGEKRRRCDSKAPLDARAEAAAVRLSAYDSPASPGGGRVSFKRVHRLWKLDGLRVHRKPRRK